MDNLTVKTFRRLINSLPIIILFLTLLTGCGGISTQEIAPVDGEEGELIIWEVCNYKNGSVKYAADCGTLIVPENRSNPESRLISLPITRIRATGNYPADPIFHLEGGPGQSNMLVKPLEALLDNHNFVMVGYRGVDGSVKLDCPEVSQAFKGDGEDVLNETSQALLSKAMRLCAERLQFEGVDLDGYTIQEVIGDLEAARQALGYERVNLISYSYGTRVAQLYANQYPAHVHRSVMVSVNPPGRFFWEPEMIDKQIEHYSQLYAQTENPRSPDLTQTIFNVSHNIPKRWLFMKIDPGKVKSATFAMLYHRDTAAQAFDAWLAAEEGDPSGLALMSLAYDFLIPKMFVYGEFFAKGFSADLDPERDYVHAMNPPESILGSPFSQLVWGSAIDEDGPVWPTALMPEEFRQVQHSDVETLLVSGNIDFATPAEYARDELLPALSEGKQVILPEVGHVNDVVSLQPDAFKILITTFFETGEVDDSQFAYAPMDFSVKWGFPLLAKVVLGGIIALLLAILTGIWLIIRRSTRKKHLVHPSGL